MLSHLACRPAMVLDLLPAVMTRKCSRKGCSAQLHALPCRKHRMTEQVAWRRLDGTAKRACWGTGLHRSRPLTRILRQIRTNGRLQTCLDSSRFEIFAIYSKSLSMSRRAHKQSAP